LSLYSSQPEINPSTIKLILFDFGGVLAEEGFRKGLLSIAQHNGLDSERFVKTAFDITFGSGYVRGDINERTFWKTLRKHTGIKGSDNDLRNEILSHFELRPWMLEYIRNLKKHPIRLAILSDQTNWLDELEAQHDFFKLFDRIFNSYHMGQSKRDAGIFTHVLAEMGGKPEHTLFIDDDFGNIARAKGKGLYTIHYQGREAFEHDLQLFFPLQ